MHFIKATARSLNRSCIDCFLTCRPCWVWRSPHMSSKLKSLPCWCTNISVVRNLTAQSLDLRWMNLVALASSKIVLRSKNLTRATAKLVAFFVVQSLASVDFSAYRYVSLKRKKGGLEWLKNPAFLKIKLYKNGKKDIESQTGFYALTTFFFHHQLLNSLAWRLWPIGRLKAKSQGVRTS